MNWKGVDSYGRCDKTRQNSFFFPNEKERKLCKKKRRRGERGEGGECLTFFKGIINSLSALVFNSNPPLNQKSSLCFDIFHTLLVFKLSTYLRYLPFLYLELN